MPKPFLRLLILIPTKKLNARDMTLFRWPLLALELVELVVEHREWVVAIWAEDLEEAAVEAVCPQCLIWVVREERPVEHREERPEAKLQYQHPEVVAERQHEKRYLGFAANVEKGTVFMKDKEVVWRCRNCGYLHKGKEAPQTCPACAHPQAHFELLAENW